MSAKGIESSTLGRKATKKRDSAALGIRPTGRTHLDWQVMFFIDASDLSELANSHDLHLKTGRDLISIRAELCLNIQLCCEMACVEAAKETNAQLASRYRGISDNIWSALQKLHYPDIDAHRQYYPGIDGRSAEGLLVSDYAKSSVAVESMLPYIAEFSEQDEVPPSLRLASIGFAARNLADDIERGLYDLASEQCVGVPTFLRSASREEYAAADHLLFSLVYLFIDNFANAAQLTIDGDRNENSPLLRWCKGLLILMSDRVPLALRVQNDPSTKMISRILEHEKPEAGNKAKKNSSLISRISKAHSHVKQYIKETKIQL